MIINILQENLLKTLTRVGRIVSPRPQLPITQNLLLQAEKGGITIAATNLETTETSWLGGKVEKEGAVCAPAKLFTEFVASLPPGTVHLSLVDESLRVVSGGFQATIPIVDAREFPPVSPVSTKGQVKLNKDVLVAALSQVLFAAATDEGRPILTGVKTTTTDKNLTLVATDGYRLSVKEVATTPAVAWDMVVPARAFSEVVKVAQEEKEQKELAVAKTDDGQLAVGVGDTQIITRLIDGEYPAYEKIIPKTWTTRVLLDKEAFWQAVRSAAIFARDNANIVRLSFDKQKLTVFANAPQVGENKVELGVKIDGETAEIAFNSRFLLEFLAALPYAEFLFEMTGALNPGVFRPVKDDSYLHLIMPVRTSSG